MFNVTLDICTTYYMAREILKGLDFRTYYGVKIAEVDTFTEQFETYAMQRILAENVKAYCFPATFLIPFLIEPFITVYLPYKIGQCMVRTHPEWTGRDAELWMVAFEFDMGRYGDLLLNMLLGVLIFFFPGGYTLMLFFGMAFSHMYIYAFDHCRVIRTIPKCVYSNMQVDWWAQFMLAPITATILTALVYKANCQGWGYCIRSMRLLEACTGAFFLHFAVHVLLLLKVVPALTKTPTPSADLDDQTFVDCAKEYPCSWFSANPIHCLRSKYIYEDSPPCSYYILGKEHLQQVNEAINCYFQDDIAEEESYDTGLAQSFHDLTQSFNAPSMKKTGTTKSKN